MATETLNGTMTYSTITHHVKVSATPEYIAEESSPKNNQFVWNYHIHIENLGDEQVQLINRHWIIINAIGQIQEVKGQGVVGVQPTLNPNEGFEYSSNTQLNTPTGLMMGKYEMVTEGGATIEVDIPPFSLDTPESKHLRN